MKIVQAILFWLFSSASAFLASSRRRSHVAPLSSVNHPTASLEDLRALSVKDLKQELESLRISTKGALEKEDLVQRLYKAYQSASKATAAVSPDDNKVLTTPMFLSSLEQDVPVSAPKFSDNQQGSWNLRPSQQPYATIRVSVVHPLSGTSFPLTLLLDTACSGILLKPSAIERHGLSVVTSPVTMTSGGGTASSNSQVTTLSKLSLEDCPTSRTFGPLPAVVQDIGALPPALDGIIGLSFLNQFDTLELNFADSTVSLFDNEPSASPTNSTLVDEADLHLLGSLGIYAVDTWWGGRGPVRMLVDTGAASTYWSWKGVTDDLKIPQNSPTVQKLQGNMGIMGSDNLANPLSHRIYVSSSMSLSKSSAKDGGLSLADNRRMAVDIGDLPILQQLRAQGIGGILGLDLLRRVDVVRVRCRGSRPSMQLYTVYGER